jgi:hypothetical protein
MFRHHFDDSNESTLLMFVQDWFEILLSIKGSKQRGAFVGKELMKGLWDLRQARSLCYEGMRLLEERQMALHSRVRESLCHCLFEQGLFETLLQHCD